jgi:hypothetical protein
MAKIIKNVRHKQSKGNRKKSINPFAICRTMQKKYHFSDKKYEKCVMDIKKKNGIK